LTPIHTPTNTPTVTPVITFSAAPTPTYLGGNFTVSASTTNTDSGVLTYSRVSGPCAFVSGATFNSTGAGVCVVQANGAPTTNFKAASQTQSVRIAKANQATLTVVTTPSTVVYGSLSMLSTTGGNGTGDVSFNVGASSGCSVEGSRLFVLDASLMCALTATKAGDANYNPATSSALQVTMARANSIVTAWPRASLTAVIALNSPAATATPDLATRAAIQTQLALQMTSMAAAAQGPRAIGLIPVTGFVEVVGLSCMILLALALVVVIFLILRRRKSPAK